MRCVHCSHSLGKSKPFIYPRSRFAAHPGCVSYASIAEMDELLLTERAELAKPTRRVYSTETGRLRATR